MRYFIKNIIDNITRDYQQPNLKDKEIIAHMKVAHIYAKLSYCKRKQVGCIVVKDGNIISIGYNGTPPGWDNTCEDCSNKTKQEVYHAEFNALAKLAGSTQSAAAASMFITCSPCYECAKLISRTNIKEVYYGEQYQSSTEHTKGPGIDHLHQCGIPTYYFPIENK